MEFIVPEVTKITGVKRLRLHQWVEHGYLQPYRPAEGPGTKNIYTTTDLYKISLFKKITERGFSRKAAAALVQLNFSSLKDAAIETGELWLVVFRRFDEGKEEVKPVIVSPDRLSDAVDLGRKALLYKFDKADPMNKPVSTTQLDLANMSAFGISKSFKDGVDDIVIINLFKIIEEIDEKIAQIK